MYFLQYNIGKAKQWHDTFNSELEITNLLHQGVKLAMKKYLFCLFLVVLFSCPALAVTSEYIEGEVLVVLDSPNASSYSGMGVFSTYAYSQAVSYQAEAFANEFGLETLDTFPEIASISGNNIIHLFSEYKSTDDLIKELSSVPGVKGISRNYVTTVSRTPNDPDYSKLWGMDNIGMPRVWEHSTGSDNVVVAVLDSGIDYNHPDLKANMIRDSYKNFGRRFENGKQLGDPIDTNGHGTHVAGTIGAAGNNGIGVAGVNWKVKMLAVNVLPDGSGMDSDIIAGINYVLSEKNKGLNIRVANMSFGRLSSPEPDSSPYGSAIKSLSDAGIICVMAAGNSGLDLNTSNSLFYPACFRFANTITVGAIDRSNKRSIWSDSGQSSNYGNRWVDIAAPGSDIYSTFLQYINNGYDTKNGTSMAVPHVSGTAALLCAAYPKESVSQIKARILSNARNIGVIERHWTSGTLDVTGAYGIPKIITPALPDGAIGIAYNQTLNAIGNTPITWSVTAGKLPTGLNLNATTGTITGTPTTEGAFNFTVRASNNAVNSTTVLSIIITAAQITPMISTSSLQEGIIGLSYSQTLNASGTASTWSVISGRLPDGLVLSTDTGLISGIPTKSGTFSFTVKATNTAGSTTRALSIIIITAPTIKTTSLPNGIINKPYHLALSVSGSAPIIWEWSTHGASNLPIGLSLDWNTGVISGTPIEGGRYTITIIASNTGGYFVRTLSLFIDPLFSGSGKGISGNPYVITTPGQLDEVRKDSTAYYRLGNNIDLTAYLAKNGAGFIKWGTAGWMPIGFANSPFSGEFDGKGNKITGLLINRSDMAHVGLFYTTYNATVKNLGVEIDPSGIKGSDSVGGLVGTQSGGSITNCYTTGNVSGKRNIGGLVGAQFYNGIITNSYTSGNISATDSHAGGIVGWQYEGKITNSYATGNITATIDNAGGIVGLQHYGSIANSYATGNIKSSNCAGGLLGIQYYGSISNSYAIGNVISSNNTGGLVGCQWQSGSITDCYRYQSAAINGEIHTENTPSGIHGGIKTAADLLTKATYRGNSWLFNDTSPTVGPWYWDNNGFPKLNMGNEIYPFPFRPPTITTTALPAGIVGQAYNQTLSSIGTSPITWSISGGTLPTGLSLNTTSGAITGKPTTAGVFNFTVRAANSAGNTTINLSIIITEIPTITTPTLPGGVVGQSYNQTLAATGTTPMTWSISIGKLPAGLDLNSATGLISGKPTTTGTFVFTVRATNSVGNSSKVLSIVISELPNITTTSLAGGIVGKSYIQRLSVTGTIPINWSIASGTLPAGLILSETTGVITGIPTAMGTFKFTIRATNAAGSTNGDLSIVVTEIPTVTTASLPGGIVGQSYNQKLTATGTVPMTWSISSRTLPAGLSLNETTGVVSGTPTAAGTFIFTVRATNSAGNGTSTLSIVISTLPTITTTSLPECAINKAYLQTLKATGTTPITWSIVNGTLPPGLSLSASLGTITGIPTASGTFNFTVSAANSAGSATSKLSIIVTVPPTVTTPSLPGGIVGQSYSQTLAATGTTPVNWTISSGKLPTDLVLNETTGVISGTPTAMGTFNFTVRATNSAGNSMKALSIVIAAPPTITTTTLNGGTVGRIYSQTLKATGTTPINWSISSGTLPTGLSLNGTTGAITGTPTLAGTFNFTVKPTNSAGNTTKDLGIVVNK